MFFCQICDNIFKLYLTPLSMKTLEELTMPFNLAELNFKFHKYYSQGRIERTELDSIPLCALKLFEGYSMQLILPEDYVPRNFSNVLVLSHDNSYNTYIVSQIKRFHNVGTHTESLLYLGDVNSKNELLGKITLIFNLTSESVYFKNKPRVGFHETFINPRQGLGARRLRVLNALSMAIYDLPLNSDSLLMSYAGNLWEKLVSTGEAIKYKDGTNDRFNTRYRFKIR